MKYLKNLMLSRLYTERIPDQKLIVGDNPEDETHVRATRHKNGQYAFIYVPTSSQKVEVNVGLLVGDIINAWWFNPEDGKIYDEKGKATSSPFKSGPRQKVTFVSPPKTSRADWVLVLDNNRLDFPPPGTPMY